MATIPNSFATPEKHCLSQFLVIRIISKKYTDTKNISEQKHLL